MYGVPRPRATNREERRDGSFCRRLGRDGANVLGETRRDRAGGSRRPGSTYIPEAERDSRPANLATVFFGGNLAFSVIVFGWLPITFGLGWWSAVTASALGLALGTLVTAPLALLGPRTGTNNTVVQRRALRRHRPARRVGADARVRARLRGDRGLDLGRRARRGRAPAARHAVRRRRAGGRLRADRGRDRASSRSTATRPSSRCRRSSCPSSACCSCSASSPSPATSTRHAARRVRARRLLADLGARGHGRGRRPALLRARAWATTRAGSRAAPQRPPGALAAAGRASSAACSRPRCSAPSPRSRLTHLGDSYVADLVAAAPGWYVLPILVIGLAGGVGQGVLNMYASGLDLEAIVPRLRSACTRR